MTIPTLLPLPRDQSKKKKRVNKKSKVINYSFIERAFITLERFVHLEKEKNNKKKHLSSRKYSLLDEIFNPVFKGLNRITELFR